jgi:NodT family efflux transporter outer membrane factor (OMF) lipoprotein
MRLRNLPVIGFGLLLTACNLAPEYHPPLIATPASYKESGPWHPAQPSDTLPRGPWWERFGDTTLNELEPRIDAANPTLAATVAIYDQARAYAAQAEAGLYPQVNLGASLSANRQSDTRPLRASKVGGSQYGANELDAQASYEIDFWGKMRNTALAGAASAQASAADLATIHLSLQAELASDYYSLRGLDADAQLLADTVTAYQKARDLTERLFQGKIVSSMDVSRADTQLETARAQVSDIAARRALLEHAIAVLVGEQPSSFSLPAKVLPFKLPDIPTGMPSTLLQRRSDIAMAERNMQAANAEIGVARAAFYPSVSLNFLGGTQSTSLSLLSLANSFWSFGPSVSLPLFNGGALDAQESATYAKFRQTNADYRATVLSAFAEVEDNLALLQWLGKESGNEDAAVTAAQHTLDVALNLYQQGADSYLEVVTAQTPLLQAQQTALDLQTRRLLADVALIRALGGGWDTGEMPSDADATKLAANNYPDPGR